MTRTLLPLLAATCLLRAAAGCGNDLSPNEPRRPVVIEAAAGESGAAGESNPGSGGDGVNTAEGGASGAPQDSLASALGSACVGDQECPSELTCLTDSSHALAFGSPPGGVCTFDCDGAALDCGALGGRCVGFADRSFCMQRCAFGNSPKCHGRDDFACEPTYRRVEVACDVDSDCGTSAVCRSGDCHVVYPVCLPRCNGPQDCPTGAACDPLSGECVAAVPSGKPLGADCDLSSSEDECRGACLPEPDARSSGGRCHEFCTLGVSDACGADADCVLTLDSAPGSGPGDVGACATRCSCDDACDFGLECVSLEGSATGYCAVPSSERPVLDCSDGCGGASAGP